MLMDENYPELSPDAEVFDEEELWDEPSGMDWHRPPRSRPR